MQADGYIGQIIAYSFLGAMILAPVVAFVRTIVEDKQRQADAYRRDGDRSKFRP